MDGLRLALLIAGVALIGGIYVFARLSRRGGGKRGRSARKPRRGAGGSESVARETRRGAEASEPFSRGPDFDTGGTDAGTAAREAHQGPGGGDPESVAREPRRGTEVSEPFSRGTSTGAGGEDSQTIARESRPGAGGGDSESGTWEPTGEAGTGDSDSIARESSHGPGGEGSESAEWEPRRGMEAPEPASRETRHDTGGEDPDAIARGPRRAPDDDEPHGGARERRVAFDPRSVDGDYDVDALGGMFAPRRKTPDEELSVDVGVLSGMRASYEGTVDDSVPPAPGEGRGQPSLDASRPIVFLTLIAKRGRLPGHAILDAFDAEGFQPGPMRIYHYRGHSEPGPPVAFGVANLVEPGVLEPDSLPGIETPGLVMFMGVADDVADASGTLEAMIAAGRRLADRLGATLCDETRSTLTAQAENHLREKVADIARRGRGRGRGGG